MIAIDNFAARTFIEDDGSPPHAVNCRVVGLVKNEHGCWDFLVITDEEGQLWAGQRDCVMANDDSINWPQ